MTIYGKKAVKELVVVDQNELLVSIDELVTSNQRGAYGWGPDTSQRTWVATDFP